MQLLHVELDRPRLLAQPAAALLWWFDQRKSIMQPRIDADALERRPKRRARTRDEAREPAGLRAAKLQRDHVRTFVSIVDPTHDAAAHGPEQRLDDTRRSGWKFEQRVDGRSVALLPERLDNPASPTRHLGRQLDQASTIVGAQRARSPEREQTVELGQRRCA